VPVATATVAAALVALIWTPRRAIPILVIASIAAIAIAAGADLRPWVARLARATERALLVVATGLTYAVAIVPAWALGRARRRSLDQVGRSGWQAAGEVAAPGRSFAARGVWAVGCVTCVLAANYVAGWAFDRVTGRDGPSSIAEVLDGDTASTIADPRSASPAMAGLPWADEYLRTLQQTGTTYWPYTESRPLDFRSRYINIEDWARRSWQPPAVPGEVLPDLWLFGGSCMFGEGQRDEHTIPSEVARLAAADGLPLRVRNYGQRGWTHFQSMVLFEQELAIDGPPTLAAFYDGPNDVNVQALLEEPVPSHYQAAEYAERLAGASIATRYVTDPVDSSALEDAWHAYSVHSLAHKVVGLLSEPAGAQDDGGVTVDGDGQRRYPTTPEDGTDAGRVYERSKALTVSIAERADVPVRFFWQPVLAQGEPDRRARAELSASTTDLSDVLDDHPEVFLDGAHTNEEGARLVAEALWAELRPAIAAWYEAHP
jgi:hypothetical protein